MWGPPPTHTHPIQAQNYIQYKLRQPHIYAQTVYINLLSQSDGGANDAENFDVFTAGDQS